MSVSQKEFEGLKKATEILADMVLSYFDIKAEYDKYGKDTGFYDSNNPHLLELIIRGGELIEKCTRAKAYLDTI